MGALTVGATTFLVLLYLLQQVDGEGAGKILRKENNDNNSYCNIYQGNWVYDESYNPLYNTSICPFIEKQFTCLQNGRPDSLFLNFRWQPSACNLPRFIPLKKINNPVTQSPSKIRFDGHDFLLRFKGKKIMFVGDSLSLNQWQSLTCMLHAVVPEARYTLVRNGDLSTFKFSAYNMSIMFSRNAFLVDIITTSEGRVLQLDSIESGKIWKEVDVLIFDTWHWWLHSGKKQPWNVIQDGSHNYKDMDRLVVYEKALRTWAKWVETTVDPTKTKVFFQGVSPDHNNGSDWGEGNANSCAGQLQPLSGPNYPGGPHRAEVILEKVLNSISKPVNLLNVTGLSQLRKDGHPSVYGHGGHNDMDCTHWCLAGVPDTWNILLYASLL